MTTSAQASSRTSCLGLPNFCGVDSIGRSGGLLLRWDDSVILTPLSFDPHYIFCKIAMSRPPCTNHVMYVLFIYGEARFEYRQSLWNRLTTLISAVTPLLLIGDFNQIELFSDKFGGTSFIRGQRDFTAWKFSNGLVDLSFFGPRFTWMNSRLHSATILERLDRAYANQDWCQLFPNASITHLPILVSDHAPIILSLFPETSSRRRPYRIDNWCLACPEVQQIVKEAWNTPFFGSSMYVVSRKLSSARHSVLQWVRNHRISCGINWSDNEADLDTIVDQIIDDQSAMKFVQLRSSRLQLLHTQRQYWIQRSKFTSEILDGFPTKFLYNRVKQQIVNYFKALLCRTTPQESNVLLDHIHPLLDGLHLPRLSPLECSILQVPFTEHDVLRALKGMDGSKSSGPDGITPKFFQVFWPQIGYMVTSAILRFLNSGVMLKEWNNTLIVLIPKVDKPELVSQYRPISLCNVLYRLASKCLANRLKLVISSLVSDSQQAFVPERLMSDGCLVAQEIMHYINKTKRGTNCYAALKLDMHKAFDRVSWQFLMSVLDHFGFPIPWRNLI
ncbi:uncharacterized protein LOC141630432 [Silene latifolia]|uniref:uncharacterized protein LOC141630432 n=1 Tax=Silene latifolia TaxID=37657 RepID=UPI003D7858BE